jgi:DNA end-binding protein Ku
VAGMAEDEQEEVRARSFWSGTITFGLVSIPVELFPANRSQGVSLRMVADDGTPLARRYFCPKENRELDWDDIVRGYEIDDDKFVVVTDEELEKLAPDKTRDIDLRRFVDAAEIDPIYFERAYYLTPGGNSTKAYRLLAETMERTSRAGIATFVMRGKEYLVAILAENGIMRAETLRFADEVRSADDVGLPDPQKPKAAAVKKYEKAIAKLVEKELDEDELRDNSAEKLLKLVAKKEKAGEDVVEAPEGEVEPSDGVIDLMEVLKRSLEGKSGSKGAAGTSTEKKSSTSKSSSTGKSTSRAAAKKSNPKKYAGKDSTAKKSSAKKSGTKKSGAKKSSAKKSSTKKSSAKKTGTKKSAAKKTSAKTSSVKAAKSGRKATKGARGSRSSGARKSA